MQKIVILLQYLNKLKIKKIFQKLKNQNFKIKVIVDTYYYMFSEQLKVNNIQNKLLKYVQNINKIMMNLKTFIEIKEY